MRERLKGRSDCCGCRCMYVDTYPHIPSMAGCIASHKLLSGVADLSTQTRTFFKLFDFFFSLPVTPSQSEGGGGYVEKEKKRFAGVSTDMYCTYILFSG